MLGCLSTDRTSIKGTYQNILLLSCKIPFTLVDRLHILSKTFLPAAQKSYEILKQMIPQLKA